MKTALLRPTLPWLALLLLSAGALHAQMTPFYTENWSGSPFPWTNLGPGGYSLYNGTLMSDYDDPNQSQLMYTGTLPHGSDYSIQTGISC